MPQNEILLRVSETHFASFAKILAGTEIVTFLAGDLAGGLVSALTVKALKTLDKGVSLKDIKENKKLTNFIMLKQNRLSVLPVSLKEWDIICKMAQ